MPGLRGDASMPPGGADEMCLIYLVLRTWKVDKESRKAAHIITM